MFDKKQLLERIDALEKRVEETEKWISEKRDLMHELSETWSSVMLTFADDYHLESPEIDELRNRVESRNS